MSVRITWAPSAEPDIESYDLERATNINGPWIDLVNISHNTSGVNFDAVANVFFYEDMAGTASHFYRLTAYDLAGNASAPSAPFHPASPLPPITNTVAVNHNFPTPGNLRYQTSGGVPIEAAIIRVYLKSDFDLGIVELPLATTMTDANGNWINPISLTTGYSYVVQFAKESLYGPDKTEIVV